jgi:hypothetical protein
VSEDLIVDVTVAPNVEATLVPAANVEATLVPAPGAAPEITVAPNVEATVQVAPNIEAILLMGGWGGGGGSGGDLHYTHVQNAPSTVWTIVHNLGKMPAIVTADSAHSVVEGDVAYLSLNIATVTFSVPFGGEAYCN